MAAQDVVAALRDALEGLSTGASLRVPPFDGTGNVRHWQLRFRLAMENKSEDVKLARFIGAMGGQASEWFCARLLADEATGAVAAIDDWQQRLAETFRMSQDMVLDELDGRRQGQDEAAINYIRDVIRLCGEVDPRMTSANKLRHLHKGLLPLYAKDMMLMDPTDIFTFQAKLLKLEARGTRTATRRANGVAARFQQKDGLPLALVGHQLAQSRWRVADGAHQMAHETWRLARCARQLTDEDWRNTSGARQMSNESQPLAAGASQVEGVPLPLPEWQPHVPVPSELCQLLTELVKGQAAILELLKRGERLEACFACGRRGHIARICKDRQSPLAERLCHFTVSRQSGTGGFIKKHHTAVPLVPNITTAVFGKVIVKRCAQKEVENTRCATGRRQKLDSTGRCQWLDIIGRVDDGRRDSEQVYQDEGSSAWWSWSCASQSETSAAGVQMDATGLGKKPVLAQQSYLRHQSF